MTTRLTRSRRYGLIAGATLLLLAGCGGGGDDNGQANPWPSDSGGSQADDASASIDTCYGDGNLDQYGDPYGWGAKVSITNTSDDTATIDVTVVFESEDGSTQHGSAVASAQGLAPGQTTEAKADAELLAFQQDLPNTYVCRVAEVKRS